MSHPKIGLALGSGGARGFAHLGVIKVLKEEGIPIDLIAGSSMGAMVGCFYGAGLEIERLYKFSTAFKRKYYLDFTVPKMGFIAGKRVKELIRVFTHGKRIEELSIPVNVVATDIVTGEKVIFKDGPISDAVRASISIPGIFVPEKVNGRLLVDGGVVDRVPVSVVKEMGADIVIAVDVSHVKVNTEITSIYDVIMQSLDILQMENVKHREIASDFMIRPRVEMYSSKAFTNIEEIIMIGEEEARKHTQRIKETIHNWKGQIE
ncbi:patatin-like phospholipase family protein [Cytobacillus horneckiae]|uniref:Esterase n=1 Tax=Cytobacillus horneckiae TaxID=549687 RepID=A0A2N0ZKG9_9BACI|nr:patatin-like phospholipase family protein [Cytobacillus horneckiae]MEC1156889.1 patatin-like phospholipase family protein [Cytobacillus horneckiae]MED2940488.1 patatin-like phospholipase family protein [Cytobacillus horneckiae]NRG46704.1 patatin-like phospholipase family protein [Bacillus sp. CRN 9]PKG30012.1 esterase [Cytobacillus horneckiae]